MNIEKTDGFQWEKSFTLTADTSREYHFGINRINNTYILAIPFIPDCFNKLLYLTKWNNAIQWCTIRFYYSDNNYLQVAFAQNVLTQLYLPSKRFYITMKANALADSQFDFMIKFLKA